MCKKEKDSREINSAILKDNQKNCIIDSEHGN